MILTMAVTLTLGDCHSFNPTHMAPNRGRTGPRWQQAKQHIYATQTQCGICGKPVNKRLPYRNRQGNVDPESKSVDHILPIDQGGQLYAITNLQLAHLRCNTANGARITNAKKRRQSRRW